MTTDQPNPIPAVEPGELLELHAITEREDPKFGFSLSAFQNYQTAAIKSAPAYARELLHFRALQAKAKEGRPVYQGGTNLPLGEEYQALHDYKNRLEQWADAKALRVAELEQAEARAGDSSRPARGEGKGDEKQ